jgi:hypothetical protein
VKKVFSNCRWRQPVMAIITVLVLSGLALGGVAVFGNRTKPTANCPVSVVQNGQEKGVVALIESDSGRTIDINKDEQLFLDLKYTPSTGNSWSVREISNPAVLSEVKTIYNPNDV